MAIVGNEQKDLHRITTSSPVPKKVVDRLQASRIAKAAQDQAKACNRGRMNTPSPPRFTNTTHRQPNTQQNWHSNPTSSRNAELNQHSYHPYLNDTHQHDTTTYDQRFLFNYENTATQQDQFENYGNNNVQENDENMVSLSSRSQQQEEEANYGTGEEHYDHYIHGNNL